MSTNNTLSRREVLAARLARDTATPPWLTALRQYIDAAIAHQIAMSERDESGYASSDRAGAEACEEAWTTVVEAVLHNKKTLGA